MVIVWFYSEHLEVLFYLLLCSICNITPVASKVKRRVLKSCEEFVFRKMKN
ncbi:hypothetical protein HMPREF1547_03695 [Blautia sp. KLE 1732]|nr:hypothetical protein HMPREF1547_03695 [Blautia sp. KLE 1732]